MSERDDRHARQKLPANTAEFRAAPDASASTAQFQAFAAGRDRVADQGHDEGSWPEQPWDSGQARRSGRGALLVVGVLVALAVVVTVIVLVAGG